MEAAPADGIQEYPKYKVYTDAWKTFFNDYREISLNSKGEDDGQGKRKYVELIYQATRGELKRIDVELDDVMRFENGEALVVQTETNTKRYLELAYKAVDEMVKESRAPGEQPFSNLGPHADKHSMYMAHRILQAKKAIEDIVANGGRNPVEDVMDLFPASLKRTYELRFVPRRDSIGKPMALRNVRGESLGKLVTVKAIVLRASDVKASMEVASFTCDVCGFEIFQEVGSEAKAFMPVSQCMSPQCVQNGTPGRVSMQTRASKFTKFQEIKVQELPEQVPVGHIPRTMTVLARGEVTRAVNAGDVIILGGVFLPTPFTGYQAIKAGLTADTYLEAQFIEKTKKVDSEAVSQEMVDEIRALVNSDKPYETLANSIAPEIFGHEDAKKALLLQLVGGMSTTQVDGMKTRGDINICLMGDPGVAKSQLLKHIARSAPRAVYTTGKGSSGVGLTAAVMRDPMTNELALEGGALVLADMGICCIDEFDKMEETDRTAIHEVMEQQTVSIAKAGITTTLNARTAVLAAANPKYSRYNRNADSDPHTNMMKNINLPAALLSRFDLLFLMLDEADPERDKALAEHITYVHMHEDTPPSDTAGVKLYSPAFVRQFVNAAKHIETHIPENLTQFIVDAYVQIRNKDKEQAKSSHSKSTTTARQLLSILRLAEARARLHFRMQVEQADIEEAIRLIEVSKSTVLESKSGNRGGGGGAGGQADTPMDKLSALTSNLLRDAEGGQVLVTKIQEVATAAGFTSDDVKKFLDEYTAESLNLLAYNPSHTAVFAVEASA